jgi:ABC-type Fe3+/spermidine/putrescine transport system ATPase subunit
LGLRVATADLTVGDPVTLSIRPHQIEFVGDHQAGAVRARDDNLVRGIVQRASFLGDAVDCQVRVEGSDVTLRVVVPVPLSAGFRPGETVRLAVPPTACIPLAESEE